MYGGGEPELLNWQILKGTLRGIGLLHYDAGASPQGERLEYIAVLDLWSGKLLAIEPGRWGERQADWTWTAFAVVVIDPLGVPSRVQVRAESAEAGSPPVAFEAEGEAREPFLPPRFSVSACTAHAQSLRLQSLGRSASSRGTRDCGCFAASRGTR